MQEEVRRVIDTQKRKGEGYKEEVGHREGVEDTNVTMPFSFKEDVTVLKNIYLGINTALFPKC